MPSLMDVANQAGGSAAALAWAGLTLRAAWLLPDWVAKWRRVLGRRE
jgi:hypothetical protein